MADKFLAATSVWRISKPERRVRWTTSKPEGRATADRPGTGDHQVETKPGDQRPKDAGRGVGRGVGAVRLEVLEWFEEETAESGTGRRDGDRA